MKKSSTQLELLENFEFAKTPVMAGIVHTREMVALRPCVENLGLNWSGQLQVIKGNSKIDQLCGYVKAVSGDGKTREMICLPPVAFQNWLWSLNPKSENFNTELWEEYKKGLVVHLMLMLKISLDEIKRLRDVEQDYTALRRDTLDMIKTQEQKDLLSGQVRDLAKECKTIQDRIILRVIKDPNQLSINII